MPTNLTGTTVAATYDQLLHVDGGPNATEKAVTSAVGVATALKVGTGSASVDNIQIDGNTISSTDTDGDIALAPNGNGTVTTSKIAITGGTVTGITDLAVADGGTGASTQAAARTNLGLGSISTQAADAVAITGGSISGASLGGLVSVGGGNLLLSANALSSIDTDGDIEFAPDGNGEVVAQAKMGYGTGGGGTVTQITSRTTGVTLNKLSGQITLVSAQIPQHESYEFVLTNSFIAATDLIVVNINNSTAADKKHYRLCVTDVSAGFCTISVGNADNSTIPSTGAEALVLSFMVLKASHS